MGRRSINTTKSGKYMNPTDQARKEARKKELKKNKRQRQMVRAAVLKNKDPGQILEEMEKIDEMEYNVLQPSPLNEKVLRDKRKKLKETFDRVMRLYHNDEPEHWAELKRKEVEYEKKRLKKQQYYESVKHAQSVQIDEIPLPSSTQGPPAAGSTGGLAFHVANRLPPPPTALSLPPFAPSAPPGAVKKSTESNAKPADKSSDTKKKELLGVPPGPPPNLLDMNDLDTDAEDNEVVIKDYNPKTKSSKSKSVSKPSSLQQRMLAISGQNIDEFMKEMENVHKKKEKEREAAMRGDDASASDEENKHKKKQISDDEDGTPLSSGHSSADSDTDDGSEDDRRSSPKRKRKDATSSSQYESTTTTAPSPAAVPVAIPLPPVPPHAGAHITIPGPPMPPVAGLAPPSMILRPPPLRPPGAMHSFGMRMPPGPPPGPRPPGMSGMPPRMGIRMPPGPPPGMPPRMAHHHKHQQQHKDQTKGVTTITAKPQIRNLSADVTRFVPSTLRVKREETRKPGAKTKIIQEPSNPTAEANKAATKDDAYMQFMNEMQGLL